MLNFSLGSNVKYYPTKNATYVYAYNLKNNTHIILPPGKRTELDTGVIFMHAPHEHLDITLDTAIAGQSVSLVMTIVDALSDANYNKTLKLLLQNNSSNQVEINMGAPLCLVVSATDNSNFKLLVVDHDILFASNDELNILDGVTADTAEINYVDVATTGVAEASKALVLDANSDISGINVLSSTTIGINETTPASQLHIKQSTDDETGGIRFEESGDTNYWGMFMDATDILQFHHNGADLGFVNTAGTDIAMNFTGQHRSSTDNVDINTNPENYIGMIVSSTGNYKNLNNSDLTVNDALPIVDLSSSDNDKSVFGVISAKEDETTSRTYQTGVFATYFEKDVGDERLFINSVGEGMVWVCDKGGNFTNGDLITTSDAVGYGQLQVDDLMHNYTLGKITQSCDFSAPEKYVDLAGVEIDQATYDADPTNGYKCNFVGCVYYCG